MLIEVMMFMALGKIEDFAKVVAWLDSARWSTDNQDSLIWQPGVQLSPSEEVLVHWLTYITDIQRPWQEVWKNGRMIFRQIVRSFLKCNLKGKNIIDSERKVRDFLDRFRKGRPVPGKVRTFKWGETEYTPRYPDQHMFIERTLTVLADQYEKNFVKFIGESIRRWKHNPDGLHHVAFELYMLTYSKENLDKTTEAFKNAQEPLYSKWDPFRYKRLWAALRDYRKAKNYLQLINVGLRKTFGQYEGALLFKTWTEGKSYDVNLLELPGDVWNTKFMKNVVQPLTDEAGIQTKNSWGASYIARQIYEKMPTKLFYPEQLDVSFDLSAKACENEDCDLCPFSKNDLRDLCLLGTSAAGSKYCPIVLAICTYRMICNPEACPLVNGLGRGLCTLSK
jgi:hypothetical protein